MVISSSVVSFSVFGFLMVYWAMAGPTTGMPPPLIQTLDATHVGPEFVTFDEATNHTASPNATHNTATDTGAESEQVVEDAKFWYSVALKQLYKTIVSAERSEETSYRRKAKNIIIFVGDGMGMTTITAGRIYKGQYLKHGYGEEEKLAFDDFPYTGLAKTYNVDKQVPDSAGTATALFCGSKTDYGAIGMDVTRSSTNGERGSLSSIMDWASAEGKRTGIVTTTRITHATPAATYANIYHRDWECDSQVPAESRTHYKDIARQLVEDTPGSRFHVILGGGLSPMGALNRDEVSSVNWEGDTENVCTRGDKLNLTQRWLTSSLHENDSRAFVTTRDQLRNVNLKTVNRLMGLFRNNHITYAIAKEDGEPSLKEMTKAAIDVLDRRSNSSGFVLLVEGGRIDQAHHQNYAQAALHEVLEFDLAIQAALKKTNPQETLILVTADHSHAVTLNGYPKRGADILGFANKPTDPMTYETISYANGPGFYDHLANGTVNTSSATKIWRPLEQLTAAQRTAPTYRHMATLPLKDETHGGEDVVVFAQGPGASLIRGVFEQNYLAFVMSYVGCMGPAKDFDDSCSSSAALHTASITLLSLVCLIRLL